MRTFALLLEHMERQFLYPDVDPPPEEEYVAPFAKCKGLTEPDYEVDRESGKSSHPQWKTSDTFNGK